MKKIVIADHHPITREGLACLIKQDKKFTIVGIANDGKKLNNVLEEENPDILILEIDLPHITGINALREIKSNFPELRILIFSTLPEEIYALRSIKAGAAGYVSKTAASDFVLKALNHIREDRIFLNEELTSTFSTRNIGETSAINRYKKLSTREVEVLNLLSSGNRNKDIAAVLNINEKTVSTYKTRLLKKLKIDNLADLINQSRMFQFG